MMDNKVHPISWTIPHCVLVLKLIGKTTCSPSYNFLIDYGRCPHHRGSFFVSLIIRTYQVSAFLKSLCVYELGLQRYSGLMFFFNVSTLSGLSFNLYDARKKPVSLQRSVYVVMSTTALTESKLGRQLSCLFISGFPQEQQNAVMKKNAVHSLPNLIDVSIQYLGNDVYVHTCCIYILQNFRGGIVFVLLGDRILLLLWLCAGWTSGECVMSLW